MAQLCAAIWSNILKGQRGGAGASAGKGNQVISGKQVSEGEEPLIHNLPSRLAGLSAQRGEGEVRRHRGAAQLQGRASCLGHSASCAGSVPCSNLGRPKDTLVSIPLFTHLPPSFYSSQNNVWLRYKPSHRFLPAEEQHRQDTAHAGSAGAKESRAPQPGPLPALLPSNGKHKAAPGPAI